jgi:predicted DCC family thiol-disulfide oxidoreductase YuxK
MKWPMIAAMDRLDEMRLIGHHGSVSSGVSAFREMLVFLPMGKCFERLFRLPGILFLANGLYRMVAKNRTRWFGAVRKA